MGLTLVHLHAGRRFARPGLPRNDFQADRQPSVRIPAGIQLAKHTLPQARRGQSPSAVAEQIDRARGVPGPVGLGRAAEGAVPGRAAAIDVGPAPPGPAARPGVARETVRG